MFAETHIGSNSVERNSQTNALWRDLLSLALGKGGLDKGLLCSKSPANYLHSPRLMSLFDGFQLPDYSSLKSHLGLQHQPEGLLPTWPLVTRVSPLADCVRGAPPAVWQGHWVVVGEI